MRFINAKKRTAGFAIPLLALRTGKGPCGEFPDIAALARLARSWKMDIIQLLPVNDTGWQTSPYSALSAFALNPVYLRIADLPELKEARDAAGHGAATHAAGASSAAARRAAARALDEARKLGEEFGAAGKVPYEDILRRKLSILEALWKDISAGEGGGRLVAEIEAWAAGHPWAKPYACFVELKRRYEAAAWWEWPEYKTVDEAAIEGLWNGKDFASGVRFRVWLQMKAAEQFGKGCAQARDLGVDIMGDIPILMNADSADLWFRRELFDTGRAAGAPPDMYAQMGQNWGFPLYRWDVLEREGYSFWKDRLAYADTFYTLYRIDHVLGFFRIWAIDKYETDGFLGHFLPEFSISYPELDALGFDAGRIRWLSRPHVPQKAIEEATDGLPWKAGLEIRAKLFMQIGDEPLFLFAPDVRGGADIAAAVRAAAASATAAGLATTAGSAAGASVESAISSCIESLLSYWRNKTLLEIAPGQFVPTWEYRETTAWKSLYENEKALLEAMMTRRRGESMVLWEKTGRKILKALTESVAMQACAEDLGAVPPCVPAVLGDLGIPGLRVLRWHRAWDKEGAPYVPLEDYPEESVACTSVHDSTNLRQWWEEEAEREAVWAMLKSASGRERAAAGAEGPEDLDVKAAAPAVLDPDSAFFVLKAFAAARSRIVVYPLQDLMAASARHRETNPADERVNVPGTTGGANWLYRMKPRLDDLVSDVEFASKIASLASAR